MLLVGYAYNLFFREFDSLYLFGPFQLPDDSLPAWSSDPVVVSNDYAYITLRDGNSCFRGVNQMDILDVSDIYNPVRVKTIAMQNPKGLGVDQNRLFVCDGIAGLKVYNLADPAAPKLINTEASLDCYDLIATMKVYSLLAIKVELCSMGMILLEGYL